MALPRFFSRVRDALTPVADINPEALERHLDGTPVVIDAPTAADEAGLAGPLMAANLAARLYPKIQLTGTTDFTTAAADLIMSINPLADVTTNQSAPSVVSAVGVTFGTSDVAIRSSMVRVTSSGWNIALDTELPDLGPGHPIANLAGASIAMGEVFRAAFGSALNTGGSSGPSPATLNLLTLEGASAAPYGSANLELPPTHLVGAGAIGQAFLHALLTSGVSAELTVVDPELITVSNLQRYVLTVDTDEHASKTDLAGKAAAGSNLKVTPVPTKWGEDHRTGPGVLQAAVALDTAASRLEVAASLPGRTYNAWTQPADIGWSRHERFGTEPCLACLYYPNRPRPSDHENIAAAFGQHPLRMLTYLVRGTPVGQPLPEVGEIAGMPSPPEMPSWLFTSLLDDLVAAGSLTPQEAPAWAGRTLGSLYRDGVCAGGLVHLSATEPEALAPLAHQSALAGVMLAAALIHAADPELAPHRPAAIEARIDMLRRLPQRIARPRQRTPGCICSDADYLKAYSSESR